jgi:glutamyl-tRNA synthetase
MKDKIITRFAPSPTGYLHVGGARTALFNFLPARKNHGSFMLRIEDTDKQRSNEAMTREIISGLQWLGLNWDGEPVHQADNSKRHRQVADQLYQDKAVYPCFCSKEELEIHRKNYQYDGHCRSLTPAQVKANLDNKKPFSIRFKVPEGQTSWVDEIHGQILVENKEIEDFVILRSDGSPVYNMAVVVDDHDMGINFVLRGDDHISNTPKQILLYQALDWKLPKFAHVPLILGHDKKRLSKRHGAASVEEYRQQGILSEALINFLALLGWNPKDDKEIYSSEELIAAFSLQGISKKSAIFDEQKLAWLNQQYIIRTESNKLLPLVVEFWQNAGLINDTVINNKQNWLIRLIDLLKARATYLTDFIDLAEYFFRDPLTYDQDGIRKYLKDEKIWNVLAEVTGKFENTKNFNEAALEDIVRNLAAAHDLSAGKLIHPLRLAISGRTATPGLFEVMTLLGKESVLRRLMMLLKSRPVLEQAIIQGRR